MVRYLLDTDITGYLIKGRYPEVRATFATIDPSDVAISVITQAETLFGLHRLPPDHHLRERTRLFFDSIAILPWGSEIADIYANIAWRLMTRGRSIGPKDEMIAAHAISLGATLITNNLKHFGRLQPELTLENWVAR